MLHTVPSDEPKDDDTDTPIQGGARAISLMASVLKRDRGSDQRRAQPIDRCGVSMLEVVPITIAEDTW